PDEPPEVTVKETVEEFFVVSDSNTCPGLPVTVLLTFPAALAVATNVTVTLEPLAIIPRLQVIGLPGAQEPTDGVTLTKLNVLGKSSVRVTIPAPSGPLLVIVMVKVTLAPTVTVDWSAAIWTLRTALLPIDRAKANTSPKD